MNDTDAFKRVCMFNLVGPICRWMGPCTVNEACHCQKVYTI